MSEVDIKAREYCEKNIPSQPEMHLTISTAFEAGWQAAMNSMQILNQRQKTKEFYKLVQSMRTAQDFYESRPDNDDKEEAKFQIKAIAEYQVDKILDRVNELLRQRGEEEL